MIYFSYLFFLYADEHYVEAGCPLRVDVSVSFLFSIVSGL